MRIRTQVIQAVITIMSTVNNVALKFTDFKFEEGKEHINKMPFSGNCMYIGKPSDGIPCGAELPIIFTPESVLNAIGTFIGMGVDVVYDDYDNPALSLTGHDDRFKIGVVTKAEIQGDQVYVEGYLWKKDFDDICFMIKNAKDSLGFSIEVAVTDMETDDEYWYVKEFTYTGLAILYKNLAAFKQTQLAAKDKTIKSDESESVSLMDEKALQSVIDGILKGLDLDNKISAAIKPLADKVEALEKKDIDFSSVTTKIEELSAKISVPPAKTEEKTEEKVVEAEADGKRKTVVAHPVTKTEAKDVSFAEKIQDIDNDKTLSPSEKVARKMKAWHESRKAEAEA